MLFPWISSYIRERLLLGIRDFHPCTLKGSLGYERAVESFVTGVFQRLHDLCLVRSFEEPIHCTALGGDFVSCAICRVS